MSENQSAATGQFLGNVVFDYIIRNGAPLLWERELPARNEANDSMIRRAHVLGRFQNVLVEVPNGALLERVENPEAGTYLHTSINGVDVHLRGELATETKSGQVLKADVTVYILVWEPKGARERGHSNDGKDAFANYAICLDLERSASPDNKADFRLDILDTTLGSYTASEAGQWRGNCRDIVDPDNGVFTHRSRNHGGKVRNQHVEFRPVLGLTQDKVAKKRTEAVTIPVREIPSVGAGVMADVLRRAGIVTDIETT